MKTTLTDCRDDPTATPESGCRSPILASVWDLDGTLLSTDTFVESLGVILLRRPWLLPNVALWLMKGRGYCKGRVAAIAGVPPGAWPVRPEAVAILDEVRREGRPAVLATAAHRIVAEAIADHLDCFDAVLASDDQTNLKGSAKLAAIEAFVADNGLDGFSYAGDSAADLKVWRNASEVIVVEPTRAFEAQVRKLGKPTMILGKSQPFLRSAWKACRLHQWAKNLLLFLPMFLAHKIDIGTLCSVILGFLSFSLCASGIYVLNDIGDIPADRGHPKKRLRPFASGRLSIGTGLQMAACLLLVGVGMAIVSLPPAFVGLIGLYIAANFLYSGVFKQVPILDVMMLACMYALRLETGAVAAGVPLSSWLLTFSLFFFTSLAFSKRYTELHRLRLNDRSQAAGRGYMVDDIELLEHLGTASGYVSVLVLALYMNSPEMHAIYGESRSLWLICPLVLYWVTRLWLLAKRGRLDDDPVVFALRDRQSLAIAVVCGGLVLASSWFVRGTP
jgi:4-hydroxybenzoate polyprenyltransferase/phosphoserine phosphatase